MTDYLREKQTDKSLDIMNRCKLSHLDRNINPDSPIYNRYKTGQTMQFSVSPFHPLIIMVSNDDGMIIRPDFSSMAAEGKSTEEEMYLAGLGLSRDPETVQGVFLKKSILKLKRGAGEDYIFSPRISYGYSKERVDAEVANMLAIYSEEMSMMGYSLEHNPSYTEKYGFRVKDPIYVYSENDLATLPEMDIVDDIFDNYDREDKGSSSEDTNFPPAPPSPSADQVIVEEGTAPEEVEMSEDIPVPPKDNDSAYPKFTQSATQKAPVPIYGAKPSKHRAIYNSVHEDTEEEKIVKIKALNRKYTIRFVVALLLTLGVVFSGGYFWFALIGIFLGFYWAVNQILLDAGNKKRYFAETKNAYTWFTTKITITYILVFLVMPAITIGRFFYWLTVPSVA